MDLILVLLLVTTFPVGCLGFLLWMARFEDGLPDAVRRAARQPDPPPVLAIPVQRDNPPDTEDFALHRAERWAAMTEAAP